nr:immunoglobulin heavy chain junction region [Mus musculus]MBK4190042.1 immunoglobulin heavy chain junction region [Mus musculus]
CARPSRGYAMDYW